MVSMGTRAQEFAPLVPRVREVLSLNLETGVYRVVV